jgi:hypothetical protein
MSDDDIDILPSQAHSRGRQWAEQGAAGECAALEAAAEWEREERRRDATESDTATFARWARQREAHKGRTIASSSREYWKGDRLD